MLSSSNQRESTRFLARILGPFTAVFSIAVMLRVGEVGQVLTNFFDNSFNALLAGILMLLGGLVIIALHPYWRGLAAIVVSLFGWTLMLRGVAVLVVPDMVSTVANAVVPNPALLLAGFAVFLVIGLYLAYVGWIAKPA